MSNQNLLFCIMSDKKNEENKITRNNVPHHLCHVISQ